MPDLPEDVRSLGRRGFLSGSLAVGAGAALAACTSNTPPPAAAPAPGGNTAGRGDRARRSSRCRPRARRNLLQAAPRLDVSDLVEQEVPASITLASATITKDNVAKYLPLGFES
jgi:hypothetical protein